MSIEISAYHMGQDSYRRDRSKLDDDLCEYLVLEFQDHNQAKVDTH